MKEVKVTFTRTEKQTTVNVRRRGKRKGSGWDMLNLGVSVGSVSGDVQETAATMVWCSGQRIMELGFINGWQRGGAWQLWLRMKLTRGNM